MTKSLKTQLGFALFSIRRISKYLESPRAWFIYQAQPTGI